MDERILAVQRMQDYIEAHLDSAITPAALARAALFSPWYSYRLFKTHTGLTPADYIRRLRLSRSALRLRAGDCRVADVAFELGFGSVDGYQRAFFREFGCNPREYARDHTPITLFIPYGVKFKQKKEKTTVMKEVKSVFITQLHKPARAVIIKRGVKATHYFEYCDEVGCDVWGMLMSMESLCGEPVCLWLPDKYRPTGGSCYVQGVEVPPNYSGKVPDGFELLSLPECDYLMFQGEPFCEEDYCEAISNVQTAMERYDPSVLGLEWNYAEPRIQLEPIGARGYIELRAVRPRT